MLECQQHYSATDIAHFDRPDVRPPGHLPWRVLSTLQLGAVAQRNDHRDGAKDRRLFHWHAGEMVRPISSVASLATTSRIHPLLVLQAPGHAAVPAHGPRLRLLLRRRHDPERVHQQYPHPRLRGTAPRPLSLRPLPDPERLRRDSEAPAESSALHRHRRVLCRGWRTCRLSIPTASMLSHLGRVCRRLWLYGHAEHR